MGSAIFGHCLFNAHTCAKEKQRHGLVLSMINVCNSWPRGPLFSGSRQHMFCPRFKHSPYCSSTCSWQWRPVLLLAPPVIDNKHHCHGLIAMHRFGSPSACVSCCVMTNLKAFCYFWREFIKYTYR